MKAFILICTLFLVLTFNPLFSLAEGKPGLSSKCLEEIKHRDVTRNKLIMNDIISTFNLHIDESSYSELTLRNLRAAHLVYGGRVNDTYYNSLKQVFESTPNFQGFPTIYIRPLNAYFLYKEKDNTNVMVLLKLKDHKWEMVEKKKTKGKEIKYNRIKCEKEYFK